MWGYGHMGGLGYGLGLGWIFQILFWVVIVWLIISLFRHHRGPGGCCGMGHHGEGKEESAVEILKKRYAKGEINKEEFERMKKDLE